MKQLSILVIAAHLFMGCSKDDPIVGIANGDEVLRASLIGTWSGGNSYRVTYYSDGTYMDSSFANQTTDTTSYTLYESRKGRYSITNSILERTEIHIVYRDSTRLPGGFLESPIGQEIQIDLNRLNMKLVDVYSLVQGNGTELFGTWTITKWVCSNSGGSPRKIYEGRRKETYSFVKDSLTLSYNWEYLDGNGPDDVSITATYLYDPPMLSLAHPLTDDRKVVFKNGKMYWYMNIIPSPMIKQY